MDKPKIILKVELEKNHDIRITLLDINPVFMSKFGHHFITMNKWRIIIGNKFQISETLTILPEESNNEVFIHHALSEKLRYRFLKSFSQAMLHLSNQVKNSNFEFANKSYITTQGNMWLIF